MTENLPSGRVFDQRIFTDFRFYIHLRRKGRTPTYLPVRTDGGIIARHAYTNIIFRDDYMGWQRKKYIYYYKVAFQKVYIWTGKD